MKELLINRSDVMIRLKHKNIQVLSLEKQLLKEISVESLDYIKIFGSPQISCQTIKYLAMKGKPIHYFSQYGYYISSSYLPIQNNYERQKKQFLVHMDEKFSASLAQLILMDKIKYQEQLLKSYDEMHLFDKEDYDKFNLYRKQISNVDTVSQMIGYEGKAARNYFYILSHLVEDDFRFKGRRKRPARDPFNSLLNYGYSLLYSYIHGSIIISGLNPGLGFIHKNKRHHAALASDLMEVWRPIIVDEIVMRLIKHHILEIEMFEKNNRGVCYIKKEYRKDFLMNLRSRMEEMHPYYKEYGKRFDFFYAIELQLNHLVKAIESQDSSLYLELGLI